jgi:diguanylate cyclase (GGDEF)-like protein
VYRNSGLLRCCSYAEHFEGMAMGRRIGMLSPPAWTVCLSVELLGLVVGGFVSAFTPASKTFFQIFVWAAVVTMVIGLLRWRPHRAGPLWLLTGYAAVTAMGISASMAPAVPATLNLQDWFYLAANVVAMAAATWLIRINMPGRDRERFLDAAIISSGFALLASIFLVKPAISTAGSMNLAIVAASQPMTDLFVLALLVSLALRGSLKNPAMRLIALGQISMLGVDCGFAFLPDVRQNPLLLMVVASGTLLMYGMFAAAFLHPGIRDITTVSADTRSGSSWIRMPLLLTAVMSGPALLTLEAYRHNMLVPDAYSIAAGCAVIFGLVVARLQALVARVHTQSLTLKDQADRLQLLASRDGLTGLTNRRGWDSALAEGLERARRYDIMTTVAIIDLDFFKQFNDSFGHPAGDRLLKSASAAWSAQVRNVDVLARYGGEEFIVLLPGCDGPAAADVLTRLRDATPEAQSFSAGIATWDTQETGDQFVARADTALYEAKRTGRARSVIAETIPVAAGAPS